MRKLEKETQTLLRGTAIVCIMSLLFAFGISYVLAKHFQEDLVTHDYGAAGYLLNHSDVFVLSAFISEKDEEDILRGLNDLSPLGYHKITPIKLSSTVLANWNLILL